jgi:hypothetical protein
MISMKTQKSRTSWTCIVPWCCLRVGLRFSKMFFGLEDVGRLLRPVFFQTVLKRRYIIRITWTCGSCWWLPLVLFVGSGWSRSLGILFALKRHEIPTGLPIQISIWRGNLKCGVAPNHTFIDEIFHVSFSILNHYWGFPIYGNPHIFPVHHLRSVILLWRPSSSSALYSQECFYTASTYAAEYGGTLAAQQQTVEHSVAGSPPLPPQRGFPKYRYP